MIASKYECFENRKTGRLWQYETETGKTKQLMEGLGFANGVALSSEEDYVIVGETCLRRVWRYWLKGEKAGVKEVILSDIPGYVDNIRRGPSGDRFWLGIHGLTSPLEFLFSFPFLMQQVAKLPPKLLPRPKPYGLVIQIDVSATEGAKMVKSLHDPTGTVIPFATAAAECDGYIYIGTLDGNGVPVIKNFE